MAQRLISVFFALIFSAAPLAAQQSDASAPQPTAERAEGIPALGMGLAGLSDWSTQHPFIDLMKTASPWVGHLPDTWGAVSHDELFATGHLDPVGWPISLPEGVTQLETLILTDQPEAANHLHGRYVVSYDGAALVEITGRATRVDNTPGEIRFQYAPGPGSVGIAVSEIDPANPIRNIRIARADQLDLLKGGALFNPDWIARIKDLRVLRFMDWMMTNDSPVQTWEDRPRLDDATWVSYGVPFEVMIALANQIGADPWFTLPHMADDTYVQRFAEMTQDKLRPGLKVYVEYSNEMWNAASPQGQWAEQQAAELWGESEYGWLHFYALRAAQVMEIAATSFGNDGPKRLVRVISTQTGWPGLEEHILLAPMAFLRLGRPPQEFFEAYAVTGYFGYELGTPEIGAQMDQWIAQAEQDAITAGEAQGLKRLTLNAHIERTKYDTAFVRMAEAVAQGSLKELVEDVLPYHGKVAARTGLNLIAYEGGAHILAQGAITENKAHTDLLSAFSYSPEMGRLYETLLSNWVSSNGTLFTGFVDVSPPSKWGNWGALQHLSDDNPRWDLLQSFNETGPVDWEIRSAQDFIDLPQ